MKKEIQYPLEQFLDINLRGPVRLRFKQVQLEHHGSSLSLVAHYLRTKRPMWQVEEDADMCCVDIIPMDVIVIDFPVKE